MASPSLATNVRDTRHDPSPEVLPQFSYSVQTKQQSDLSNMLEFDIDSIQDNEHVISANQLKHIMKSDNNNTEQIDAKQVPHAKHSIARRRWTLLAKALTNHGNNNTNDCVVSPGQKSASIDHTQSYHPSVRTDDLRASVRRFGSFDLMQQVYLPADCREQLVGQTQDWVTYRLEVATEEYCVNIHHINRPITAADLMGFNNTGNVCVWPSEEALAFHTLTDLNSFDGKMVLELGGGMTCLAGLLVAKYGRPFGVHLTDGNRMSVENVRKTCRLNDIHNCYVKCSVLKWEQNRELIEGHERFDYILCADCLFFDEARPALVDTMWACLAETGTALVMAPRRGTTLDLFVGVATTKGFRCEVVERYNEAIWQRHLQLKASSPNYDEDIHYPILIKLNK